jgi:hypothetical protein
MHRCRSNRTAGPYVIGESVGLFVKWAWDAGAADCTGALQALQGAGIGHGLLHLYWIDVHGFLPELEGVRRAFAS